MRFVLEITEKERDAIRKAGKDIKKVSKKLKDSFNVRVIKDKK